MNKIVKIFCVFIAIVILTQSFYVCAVNANNKNDKTRESVDVSKYNISVKVDADKHKINGKVLMKITNNTNKAIKRICIRNYAASILGKKGKCKNGVSSKVNRLSPRVSRFQKRMTTVHERINKTENEQFVAKCQRMLVVNT